MTAIATVALDSVEVAMSVRVRRLRAVHHRYRINVDHDGWSFGDRVLLNRTIDGLTQRKLAELAGLSEYAIQRVEWERVKCVHAETVGLIAKALGVEMGALWWGLSG